MLLRSARAAATATAAALAYIPVGAIANKSPYFGAFPIVCCIECTICVHTMSNVEAEMKAKASEV
jgi:hypothetical protein